MIEFQRFPLVDLDNGVFRAWWFDPLLSTLAFGFFINWYWYYEKRFGLISGEKDYKDPRIASGVAYWVGIFLWKLVVPPAAATIPDGFPTDPSESCYLVAEVVTGIVLYDAMFFFVHWAMHDISILRKWHHRHHQNGPTECRDTLRHGLVDGSLQVLVNILVQRKTPWGAVKTRFARALHNVIVIWMLTESHAAAPVPNIWRRWCVGVRDHQRHHDSHRHRNDDDFDDDEVVAVPKQRYTSYGRHHRHQQFFGYLDDLRALFREWRLQRRKRSL